MFNRLENLKFPDSFSFGVADADLQVVGENNTLIHEEALPTMWTECAKKSDAVFNNDTPLEAIDRYNLWKEDVAMIKGLEVGNYRTSVSMSRLLKENGEVNQKAVDWYVRFFKEIKAAGLKISVTLYHWELPNFLHEKGGWLNRETVDFFVRHCKVVYENLNEYIDEYFLVNEHVCVAFLGYHLGIHAPFQTNLKEALQAGHYLLLAQGMGFRALKSLNANLKVSTVYSLSTIYSKTASEEDFAARRNSFEYSNLWLLEPIFTGRYPDKMQFLVKDIMPKIEAGDMEIIKIGAELHTLGINYYFGQTVKHSDERELRYQGDGKQFEIRTGLGWPVYVPPVHPEGLYDLLLQIYHRYELFGLKRIAITENGTAWPNEFRKDGSINDSFRIEYLRTHLFQVLKAIKAGVPVEAYFLWTLMDNYEWQEGYRPESSFGLVYVDRKTMKRKEKDSYFWYKNFVKTRSLN